ncbi:hypothetical protein ABEB36_007110 [Hypothenemus hampei]|uniref:V-type proton ATPase subunit G n=1 Tax=Hypothenemus hampei TaxID=57062 RepID=A0ABD1ESY4_HYPHA
MPGLGQIQGNQGIQQLLAAEKKAAEKVADARKRKIKRLKQASDEARAEIEAYSLERERSYLELQKRQMGTKDDIQAHIDTNTNIYLENLEKTIAKNRDKVLMCIQFNSNL